MSLKQSAETDAPIHKLDIVDSTNNYAMRLIDADTAVHGHTIMANTQTAGKGQRGKDWLDSKGDSLSMSIVVNPFYILSEQPIFLAAIATAVADGIQQVVPHTPVYIKWPNDIIVNDKKTAGILIENVVRGQHWAWSIIGIGVNVGQSSFPPELPQATSLRINGCTTTDAQVLGEHIRDTVNQYLNAIAKKYTVGNNGLVLSRYNSRLYNLGHAQYFRQGDYIWHGIIEGMNTQGQLQIRLPDNKVHAFAHGTIEWVW